MSPWGARCCRSRAQDWRCSASVGRGINVLSVVENLWSSELRLGRLGGERDDARLVLLDHRRARLEGLEPTVHLDRRESLTLYLMHGMGFFSAINMRLVGRPTADWAWISELTAFALLLLTARFLYRRGIFLRV